MRPALSTAHLSPALLIRMAAALRKGAWRLPSTRDGSVLTGPLHASSGGQRDSQGPVPWPASRLQGSAEFKCQWFLISTWKFFESAKCQVGSSNKYRCNTAQ